jgi:hypothetical protein
MKAQLAATLLTLLCAGCAEIRASSRAQLASEQSRLQFSAADDGAIKPLIEAFARRGFPIVDRQQAKDGTYLTFKGARTSVTVVTGTQYGTTGQSTDVGSVFYARVTPGEGGAQVELFGKPTVSGLPVCSDHDSSWKQRCEPVVTGALWPGRSRTTGREEAEIIRGIILELSMSNLAAVPASSEPAASAQTAPPKCVASDLPEWGTASPARKKQLLADCRPEVASDATP